MVLNRPEVHNAFNETLIAELTAALRALDADAAVRAVVLTGAGESFCAGADLNWMTKMARFSWNQNLADVRALADALATLNGLAKPTLARVHGNVFRRRGLVACCDIAIAEHNATFAFSEAKLGLIPATISPYVIEAIGARRAPLLPDGERFTAAEAFRLGLLHDLAPLAEARPAHQRGARLCGHRGAMRAGRRQGSHSRGGEPHGRCEVLSPTRRSAWHGSGQPRRPRRALPPSSLKRRQPGFQAESEGRQAMEQLDTWQLIALAAALGWASGIRLYAVLFIVGAVGYAGWVDLPEHLRILSHPLVLTASGFMVLAEFLADKIPGFDSVWDLVHTFVRIPAGAALAAGVFGDSPPAWTLAAAILGGTLAAGSHFTKAGARVVINTSPEPFSNWAASFGEDLLVGALIYLALAYPLAALVVIASLVLLSIWLLPKIARAIKGIVQRLASWFGGTGHTEEPAPEKRGDV